MALVSITEAAKLVRRNRSTLYRDIERGRLSKTITPEGETQIDTAELLRAYGRLYSGDEENGDDVAQARTRIAILEERTRSLERALQLEAELRRVKDQVTNELRARLADKDNVIKVLESKVLFLEYDKEVEALQPERQDKESKEARAPQEDLSGKQSREPAVPVERAASTVAKTSAEEPVKAADPTPADE
ncbi:hypothetical protein E4K72_15470, partial [Oxalobacteraceae bacterium OM1]